MPRVFRLLPTLLGLALLAALPEAARADLRGTKYGGQVEATPISGGDPLPAEICFQFLESEGFIAEGKVGNEYDVSCCDPYTEIDVRFLSIWIISTDDAAGFGIAIPGFLTTIDLRLENYRHRGLVFRSDCGLP